VGTGSGISVTLSTGLEVFLISQGIKAPVIGKRITIPIMLVEKGYSRSLVK